MLMSTKRTRTIKLRVNQIFGLLYLTKLRKYIRGQFCERCGRCIGLGFVYKRAFKWRGFNICKSCLEDKMDGKRNKIDLEDMLENKINLINK